MSKNTYICVHNETMMRLVYCIHSLHLFGGIERVLTIKANYLADVLGYQVFIVTAYLKGRKPHFPLSDKIKLIDLGVSDKVRLDRYYWELDKVLCRIKPDICISTGGREMYRLTRCHDGSRKVLEYHFSHEKYAMKYGGSPLGDLYAKFRIGKVAKAASLFDRFVVLTESDADTWRKDVPGVESISNPLTFRTERAAALDAHRCIAVGRLEPQKNFGDLVDAWKEVAPGHPGWTLDIFGEGHLREKLGKKIAEAGLDGKVRLMGSSGNIVEELLSSSCFVMSSRYEGFPMALIEAAECGLPLVSYDCPKGPSDIISDGKSGYLVPMGDTSMLASRVCELIDNQAKRKEFGHKARESASRFTIDTTMARWNDLFHRVAAGKE